MAWTLVTVGGKDKNNARYKEGMLDKHNDIAIGCPSKDEAGAPGSVAYTADMGSMWILNSNGEWVAAE